MLVLLYPGSFCFGFLLAFTLNWLALIPWRRSAGMHWTQRARLLYPAGVSARLNNWLIPASMGFFCFNLNRDINYFMIGSLAFLGATLAGFLFSREVHPHLNFSLWLRLVAAALFLFFAGWLVLVAAIFYMPANFGLTTWIIAGAVLVFLLLLHFGLNIRLLRCFGVLQPATEKLNTLVAEVSLKMRVPVQATWILSTYVGNAAAFPLARQLIFTDKLLEILSDEETKTVCAHELGHLSESRLTLLVRGLAACAFYPLIFTRPLSSCPGIGDTSFCILLIGSILLLLSGIRVGRAMEKRADKMAVENKVDGIVYARALARLYENSQSPAVMPRRSGKVHPDLYDRMIAAGVTPDFPKPEPPSRRAWTSYVLWGSLIFFPILFLALRIVFFS
jgi:Zn-dependent protease with chaperone function